MFWVLLSSSVAVIVAVVLYAEELLRLFHKR